MGPATYNETNVGEYVDCENRLCYNGGVSIGQKLRDMVRGQETEAEFSAICKGYEGSPQGRRKYRTCLNRFEVKIRVEYNPPVHIDPEQIK
jgi:hypothetical protein